jgi:hypothetical protein
VNKVLAAILGAFAALVLTIGPDGPVVSPDPPVIVAPSEKATAATYVYERLDTDVPNGVHTALDKLNRRGVMATLFEDDETIPAQYRVAVPAAREVGLPALVVQNGEKVLRVVKAPTTETAVLGAAP